MLEEETMLCRVAANATDFDKLCLQICLQFQRPGPGEGPRHYKAAAIMQTNFVCKCRQTKVSVKDKVCLQIQTNFFKARRGKVQGTEKRHDCADKLCLQMQTKGARSADKVWGSQ